MWSLMKFSVPLIDPRARLRVQLGFDDGAAQSKAVVCTITRVANACRLHAYQ
jgi:hypothetical protein